MEYIQFGTYDNSRRKVSDPYAIGDQVWSDDVNWLNERLLNIIDQNGLPNKLTQFRVPARPQVVYDIPVKNGTAEVFAGYAAAMPVSCDDDGVHTVTKCDDSLPMGYLLLLDQSGLPSNGYGRGSFAIPGAWAMSDTGTYGDYMNLWNNVGHGYTGRTAGPKPGIDNLALDLPNFLPLKQCLNQTYKYPTDPVRKYTSLFRQLVHNFPYAHHCQIENMGAENTASFPLIEFPGAYLLKVSLTAAWNTGIEWTQAATLTLTVKKGNDILIDTGNLYHIAGQRIRWEGSPPEGELNAFSYGLGGVVIINMEPGVADFDIKVIGSPSGVSWDLQSEFVRIGSYARQI